MQFFGGYLLGGLTVTGLGVSFAAGALTATYWLDKVNAAKNEAAKQVTDTNAEEILTKFYKDFFNKK